MTNEKVQSLPEEPESGQSAETNLGLAKLDRAELGILAAKIAVPSQTSPPELGPEIFLG